MNKNVVRGTITKYLGPISDWLSCISHHHQQQQTMWGNRSLPDDWLCEWYVGKKGQGWSDDTNKCWMHASM